MTSTANRWGGARARAGATDTTMLIWKVINANPGITADELLVKVSDQIPLGWAKRRFAGAKPLEARVAEARGSASARAKRYVLSDTLSHMRRFGAVRRDEAGRYTTERPIKNYSGDSAQVDETGDVAAEHLNAAYALKKLRAFRARAQSRTPRFTAEEYEAFCTYMDWVNRRTPDELTN